eukprot:TRINITY_DN5956_c4_g2_i1.p1 TRINITY_DN5956_c4_g2~~TRINITY_DN5956_c4_g2_i1.p1  ORF type:complete len:280 (+),score=31.60 TRINITY_DN5956_c4_g2_i1:51-842(+)
MAAEAFWAGGISGAAAIVVTQPLDVLKVRQQVMGGSILRNALKIVKEERIIGLWKGLVTPCSTSGVMNAVLFMSYEGTMRHLDDSKLSSHAIAGFIAGIPSVLITSPTELVKCRTQVGNLPPTLASEIRVAKELIVEQGYRGLSRGLLTTWARDCPSFAIYFASYEYLSQPCGVFMAGGIAGMLSWAGVYPIDVIKTNWQVSSSQSFRKFLSTYDFSFRPLFRGFSSAMLRAWPQHAITFTMYDFLKSLSNPYSRQLDLAVVA